MVFQIPVIMNIIHMQVDFQQNISKIRNMSSFLFLRVFPPSREKPIMSVQVHIQNWVFFLTEGVCVKKHFRGGVSVMLHVQWCVYVYLCTCHVIEKEKRKWSCGAINCWSGRANQNPVPFWWSVSDSQQSFCWSGHLATEIHYQPAKQFTS